MNKKIIVRAGVPQPSGTLVTSASIARLPVLFSANAFALTKNREFLGFNTRAAANLPEGLDAALDSAGFVAAVVYGDYRWSPEQYYDLVAARKWAWHAAMDFCCEPPVAGALVIRKLRLEATASGDWSCVAEAKRRDLDLPLCVLQGWYPEDYVRCVDMLAIQDWPDMVGVGSVCRRNVGGPDGIEKIVDALDRVLPKHVKFHFFGVKGGAVKQLGGHHRFASLDSMAYDYVLRTKQRTGRTQLMRVEAMIDWQTGQAAVEPMDWQLRVASQSLLGRDDCTVAPQRSTSQRVADVIHTALSDWYGGNLLVGHGYRSTNGMAVEQATFLCLVYQTSGLDGLLDWLAESSDSADQAVLEALDECRD